MSLFNKIKKSIVQNNSTVTKHFSYSKNGVNLDFDLRTDTKTQLKDFAELLKVAILEVDNEINK